MPGLSRRRHGRCSSGRGETGSHYYDPDGRLRIILEPVTFDEMVSASFDLLRHASRDTAPVLQQMLDVIAAISREAASPGPRTSLLPQVRLIREEARSSNLIEEDRQSIGRSADLLKTTLTCPM